MAAAEWRAMRLEPLVGSPRPGMQFESDLLDQDRATYEIVEVLAGGDLWLRKTDRAPEMVVFRKTPGTAVEILRRFAARAS